MNQTEADQHFSKLRKEIDLVAKDYDRLAEERNRMYRLFDRLQHALGITDHDDTVVTKVEQLVKDAVQSDALKALIQKALDDDIIRHSIQMFAEGKHYPDCISCQIEKLLAPF